MSKGWVYASGDWNLICDVCSKKIKASLSKKRWDGFITCSDCWEIRHPQDFVKAAIDKIVVPFTRPQGTDQFVNFDKTERPTDTVYINETLTKDVTIVVPNVASSLAGFSTEAIGELTLGSIVLGASGASTGYSNVVTLSEVVTLSFTMLPTDSFGFTESMVVTHEYNKSLGSTVLGSITLG